MNPAPSPLDALRELHAVCVAMDAENEATRPSEEEYQAAMSNAAAVLTCWRCTQPATCKENGFCSIERRDLGDLS